MLSFSGRKNRDMGSDFMDWWKDVPLWSSFIFISTVTTSVLIMLNPFSFLYFYLFLFNTVEVVELHAYWQFITYPYISLDVISAAFSLFSYMSISVKKERKLGTFRFILYFTLQNIMIGLVSIPLYYLFAMAGVPPLFYFFKLFIYGLWPSIMVEMVLEDNTNGDELVQFMCFPITIKKKYYPWLFFLFNSALFGVIYSLLLGIIVGYIYLWKLMKWSEISDGLAEKLEKTCICLRRFKGFVSTDKLSYELPGQPSVFSEIFKSPPKEVIPFSGKGHRLGTDDE